MFDRYRPIRIKPESARAMSDLAFRTRVPQCDLFQTLTEAVGGVEQAAYLVNALLESARRPFNMATETRLATARLAAIGRAMK